MRAAVLVDVGRTEVGDVPCPSPEPREVLVRVTAVGLCGTDLHIFAGHANYNRDARGRPIPLTDAPQILGHEIAGVVEAVGADVRDLSRGDQVVVDQGRSCVSEARAPGCEYGASGDSHRCELYREHGIAGLRGGFAEYLPIRAVNAVRIDSDLDAAAAALSEPLGCVAHCADVLTRTPARYTMQTGPGGTGRDGGGRGERVRCAVICGAGPAGLLWMQYLRNVLGYEGVLLVSEPNARKRALAERFGAETIDPAARDPVEVVHERTGGRRAELLIEATGSGQVFATIPALIRKQATVLLYGHGHAGVDLSLLNQLQFLEPTLLSPVGASGGFERDGRPYTYVAALRLIEIFESSGADAIVSPSGSCTAMLHHYEQLFEDEDWQTRARQLAQRTHELSAFLVNCLGVEDVGAAFSGRLTWHDACHGLRDLGIRNEPRRLLRHVKGAELVELPNAETCCGFGGTFAVKYPEVSVAMLDEKVDAIERAGVDAVVSGDAGCLMQIGGRPSRRAASAPAPHLAGVRASRAAKGPHGR